MGPARFFAVVVVNHVDPVAWKRESVGSDEDGMTQRAVDDGSKISVGDCLELRLGQSHRLVVERRVVRRSFGRHLAGGDMFVENKVLGILGRGVGLHVKLDLVSSRTRACCDEKLNLDVIVVGITKRAVDSSGDGDELVSRLMVGMRMRVLRCWLRNRLLMVMVRQSGFL